VSANSVKHFGKIVCLNQSKAETTIVALAGSLHGYSHHVVTIAAEATLDEIKELCLGQRAGLSADPKC